MSKEPLLAWTQKGLYCAAGDFYIDPHRVVERAVTTHAHSDHARRGAKNYFTAKCGVGLLKARLGKDINVQGIPYGETFKIGPVKLSFHSAGHILGSAQVRIEHQGEVWVASGDYKRDSDPSCDPFEVVPCDTYVTEATFGTPKYQWDKNSKHGEDIHRWWMNNARANMNSLLFGYSLGKAQRILAELAPYADRPVIIHDTVKELTECYRAEGRKLAPTVSLSDLPPNYELRGELILAPPSLLRTEWLERLGLFQTAFASGWMHGGYGAHGQQYDHGFVMSDHADWNDIHRTIEESGAKRVFVQHRSGALIRSLRKKGLDAHPVEVLDPKAYAKLPEQTLSLFDFGANAKAEPNPAKEGTL
ncbi:MAG: ligase-associated DNA damage response exonuclease [Bdellovibrionia bacterium]